MSTLNERICEALTEYLKSRDFDCDRVVSWEDGTKSEGYCETCYCEYAAVDTTYVDPWGATHVYEYYGSFSELIKEF